MLASAILLSGCGGSRPKDEDEPRHRESSSEASEPEKAAGVVSFHYANKSTDANLQVDLGATDISLEMSGKPAEAARSTYAARAEESRKPQDQKRDQAKPKTPQEDPEGASAQDPEERQAANKPERRNDQKRKPGLPKPDPRHEPEPYSEDGPDREEPQKDVTDKVLQGIRKAQEFFYQKRYPEALEMVRQSLEARPTAEGHALAGSIHYMMGATGLARRHWQEALRLNPDMPAVTNMLEKIATPGGRGSPHPRPLAPRRNAAAPSQSVLEAASPMDAPFPEEYGEPASAAPPAPAPAPAMARPAAPPAPAPAPAPATASAAAEPAPEEHEAAAEPAAPAPAPAAVAAPAPAAAAAKPAETAAPAPAKSEPPAKPKFPQKPSVKDAATPAKETGAAKDSGAPAKTPAAPAKKEKGR